MNIDSIPSHHFHAIKTIQSSWGHIREREQDTDPWIHSYTGYIYLRTDQRTQVFSRTFKGMDEDALQETLQRWFKLWEELVQETASAITWNTKQPVANSTDERP